MPLDVDRTCSIGISRYEFFFHSVHCLVAEFKVVDSSE